jgi:parallel beta-helix repeat protein
MGKERNKKLDRRKFLKGVSSLALASGLGYLVGKAQAQTSSITIEPASFQTEASYIIFNDNGVIKARNGKTGNIDFSGTDASTVIQNVLNALTPNRTWKEKVVFQGNFEISPLNLVSYLILDLSLAVLKLKNGVNDHVIKADNIHDFEIIGGTIDGNKNNQSQGNGIYIFNTAHDFLIKNVEVRNCKEFGIEVKSYAYNGLIFGCSVHDNVKSGIVVGEASQYIKVIGNVCYANGNSGILLDSVGYRNVIALNNVYENYGSGISIFSATSGYEGKGTIISNNICRGNSYYGIEVNGYQAELVIDGNTCFENNMHGIRCYESKNIIISNNVCFNNSTPGQPYDGINIVNGLNLIIIGNRCCDDKSARTQRYGISIEGVYGYSVIVGNNVSDNAVGGISIGSGIAGCIVKNNRGYDTENFKATGLSIAIGTGNAYGSATAITSRSGVITYPRVKITWGGTFGTGETVTVKVEAVYTDDSTAYIEKSATAVGSLWLTDDDVLSLITQGKNIVKLNVYAKTSLASTTVTVTVDAYGKA